MDEVIVVDRIRCDGYGYCAELLPEMVTLDEWGFPVVRPGPVPERLRPLARRAVAACPVLALRLQRVASQPGSAPARLRVSSGAGGR